MIRTDNLRSFPGTRWAFFVFFLYLYLPIFILVILSFNASRQATIWTGWSMDWYLHLGDNPQILAAAKNSLLVASFAAFGAATLALMAALALSPRGRGATLNPRATVATAVLSLPLIVPEVVTAVASLLFFVKLGEWTGLFQLGLTSIILAHITFCIPFAYLPIRARLEGLDPAFREAAADLYADRWQSFCYVILPLIWPGILSGGMLAFIISLDDFVITQMLSGPGSTTLPVYIYGLIRVGVTPEVNAISTVMLMVSIAVVSLSFLIGRSTTRVKG